MVTANKNFLSNINFKFKLDSTKYPNLEYFCVAANLPGVTITPVEARYKSLGFNFGSDSIQYDDLVIKFNVTENLDNYIETYDWIKNIVDKEDLYTCDAVLHILSSHNNTVKEIKFYDIFPISISSLEFDAQNTNIQYQPASVTFKYTKYEII
jgi:hypothetical protein